MANKVQCAICHQMTDEANVMVDNDEYTFKHEVNALEIVCKSCTRKTDAGGTGRSLHNLWEWRWFDRSAIRLLATPLSALTGGDTKKWSKQAVNDFYKLLQVAHPELCDDPLAI